MGFERTSLLGGGPAITIGASGTFTFPLKYAVAGLIGFKVTTTGDTSADLSITDADGRFVFAQTGTNYTTTKDTVIGIDTTGAGGTGATAWVPVDSTGTGMTIALATPMPARSPLNVVWASGTAGDTITRFDAYYEGPYDKTTIALTVPNPAGTVSGTLNTRAKFVQLVALSATASADTTTKLSVTDADSRVVFLDANDADYTTRRNLVIGLDDTLTGLTPQHVDGTGAAATSTSAAPRAIARGPLTIAAINNGTAGATYSIDVYTKL